MLISLAMIIDRKQTLFIDIIYMYEHCENFLLGDELKRN